MMLKVQLQGFVKRQKTHKENIIKACTLLMQQCTEKMENQLKNRDDFSSKLMNNPIELVKATKDSKTSSDDNHMLSQVLSLASHGTK